MCNLLKRIERNTRQDSFVQIACWAREMWMIIRKYFSQLNIFVNSSDNKSNEEEAIFISFWVIHNDFNL